MLNLQLFNETAPGPALLIAHGLYGSGRNWGVIAKRLSDERTVVTVDMRNHGQSDWQDSHTYTDLAADLSEVVHHLARPVDVLGHSMGGKAAMTLALTEPERVHRLISADIAPVTYTHSQMQFIEAMRAVDLTQVERRSDAESQLGALGVEPALQSFFTQSLDVQSKSWRLNLDGLADNMAHIMSFPDLSAEYSGPTLFLSGGDSDYVRSQDRGHIRTFFPNAHFAKIPNAGHWLHAEKPREFEATVRTFLRSTAHPT
ncbi:MAG: alpha/beta fold hydrolase [Paracoccaceae bacterium]